MIIDLTIREIKDLAEACGMTVDVHDMDEDDLDIAVCIDHCPSAGVTDDDGNAVHTNYVMYFSDCPDEGVIPLGILRTER